jgi:signal transduction histidine kinase
MREELQSLQQQVIRQERLAAIGVLVSGVAHELNNPLQAILGFAELLQMQKDMPEQARGGPDADSEGERPRQRDHPEPVAIRPADVGADAGPLARRRRLGDGAAPAQARRAEHRGRARRTIARRW